MEYGIISSPHFHVTQQSVKELPLKPIFYFQNGKRFFGFSVGGVPSDVVNEPVQLKTAKPRLGPPNRNGTMAKDACCYEQYFFSAECVRSKPQLREFCGFATCVGLPDWPINTLSGLEKWRDISTSKIECMRTTSQVSTHESPECRWLHVGARSSLWAYKLLHASAFLLQMT